MNKLYFIFLTIAMLLVPAISSAQTAQMVTGSVIDETDEPLIGATIYEIDKNNRVISTAVTDINGEFSISVKNPKNRIKVSYVGYDPAVLPIKPKMDIKMESNSMLQELVVTGQKLYDDGTMPINRAEISGAVQSIKTEAFEGIAVTSIDDALQGRLAGLDIVNASGDLGSGSAMRIRGSGSINSNSTPLIVLNDIPYESHVDGSFDYANATSEQFANLLSINP